MGIGRTYQIPILLARRYLIPGAAKDEGHPRLGRYFLDAHRMRFRQPSTGEQIALESLLPRGAGEIGGGTGVGREACPACLRRQRFHADERIAVLIAQPEAREGAGLLHLDVPHVGFVRQ